MRRAPALDATRGPCGAPYPPYDASPEGTTLPVFRYAAIGLPSRFHPAMALNSFQVMAIARGKSDSMLPDRSWAGIERPRDGYVMSSNTLHDARQDLTCRPC